VLLAGTHTRLKEASMSTRPQDAHPYTVPISTERVTKKYIGVLGLAQFGIFIAILAPVFVSMQLKAQQLNPDDPASVIASVLPVGALGALVGSPVFGALSDRTRTRWGRRKPWLLGGIITLTIALGLVSISTTVLALTLSWLLCQLASNAASAALVASFADNVPEEQRGQGSSVLALGQNVSILAGTYIAAFLANNLPLLFIVPGLIGVVLVTVYVFVSPDYSLDTPARPFSIKQILGTFWTNPLRYPDFGLAWWSRFFIQLATFMFTTYRLFYMEDHIGLGSQDALNAVATGVLLYTIALFVGITASGWLSDRLHRRKIFVAGSTVVFAVGLITLAHADSVNVFYVGEVILGFAYGVYAAVDNALVIDVLPDPAHAGKDLGVINIANSIPQSIAPAIGLVLLGTAGGDNYTALLWGAGIVAICGAAVIIPIKKVR
jgi:MFS family permease